MNAFLYVFLFVFKIEIVTLHRVFHGIRLLRLTKIGCRETINFFNLILF